MSVPSGGWLSIIMGITGLALAMTLTKRNPLQPHLLRVAEEGKLWPVYIQMPGEV